MINGTRIAMETDEHQGHVLNFEERIRQALAVNSDQPEASSCSGVAVANIFLDILTVTSAESRMDLVAQFLHCLSQNFGGVRISITPPERTH